MLSRSKIFSNTSCTVFRGSHSTQRLPEMISVAEHLVGEKHYKSAQDQYKKIMDAYPNYAGAYDQYFQLQLKTVGPLGLKQSLFNHLQKIFRSCEKVWRIFSRSTSE